MKTKQQNYTVSKVDGEAVGVIKIPSFYIGLTDDVKKLLVDAEKKKIGALIVDLRENGGGALTEAVALSGLFITDGPVVQVRDAYQRIRVTKMMIMLNNIKVHYCDD